MDNLKSDEKIESKKYGFLEYFFAYLAFLTLQFAINLPITLQVKMINMGSDEYNILSMAAFLSGTDWSSYNRSIDAYHGFGAALLYLPVFLLVKNVWRAYQIVLYENIVFNSLVAIIVYYILRYFFGKPKRITSFLLAFLTSVYPIFLTSGKFTWSEPAVILFCFLNVFFALKLYNHYNDCLIPWSLGTALVAGYSYMIHGRNIIFPILCVLEQVYLFFINPAVDKKIKIKRYIVIAFTIIMLLVFYKVNGIVIGYFKTNLWHANELRNTMESLATNRIMLLKDINNIILMFKAFLGQLFYANSATLGFFSLFIGILFYCIYNKKCGNTIFGFLVKYVGMAYLLSTVISIAGLISGITSNTKWAYYVWGRYTEIHCSIMVLICFLSIEYIESVEKVARKSYWILVALSVLFVKLTIPNIIQAGNNGGSTSTSGIWVWLGHNIFNLYNENLMRFEFQFYKLAIIILVCGALTFILYSKKKVWIVYAGMLAFFLYSFYYVSIKTIVPNAQRNYKNMQVLNALLQDYNLEGENIYYISRENRYPSELQLFFYDSHVVMMNNPLESSTLNKSVISEDMNYIISKNGRLEDCIEDGMINDDIILGKEKLELGSYTVYLGNVSK